MLCAHFHLNAVSVAQFRPDVAGSCFKMMFCNKPLDVTVG